MVTAACCIDCPQLMSGLESLTATVPVSRPVSSIHCPGASGWAELILITEEQYQWLGAWSRKLVWLSMLLPSCGLTMCPFSVNFRSHPSSSTQPAPCPLSCCPRYPALSARGALPAWPDSPYASSLVPWAWLIQHRQPQKPVVTQERPQLASSFLALNQCPNGHLAIRLTLRHRCGGR